METKNKRKSLSTEEAKALLDKQREYIKSGNGEPSDFSNSSILGMRIEGLNLTNTNFREAIVSDVAFVECLFQDVDFSESTFCGVQFDNCLFVNCNLDNIDWTHYQLLGCSFFND